MVNAGDKVAPNKSSLSHFQKAIAWGVMGLLVLGYGNHIGEGFGKLRLLQFAFFVASFKALKKGIKSQSETKTTPAEKPSPAAYPTSQTEPGQMPYLAAHPTEPDSRRWLRSIGKKLIWVVLFVVLWQLFERI